MNPYARRFLTTPPHRPDSLSEFLLAHRSSHNNERKWSNYYGSLVIGKQEKKKGLDVILNTCALNNYDITDINTNNIEQKATICL
ncbi:hypothetical protein DPMN_059993 [Dreissena polymorpha]|uniref:Uncharacterized protein n=1 Tax=Dreissena polymorpha TaxID=45954 RepID=A0A9D4HFJ6_DREPO|nr:hypothetical protein DPMN_059993 [Dreissena polymorpha]